MQRRPEWLGPRGKEKISRRNRGYTYVTRPNRYITIIGKDYVESKLSNGFVVDKKPKPVAVLMQIASQGSRPHSRRKRQRE